jgi:hypothetical protein
MRCVHTQISSRRRVAFATTFHRQVHEIHLNYTYNLRSSLTENTLQHYYKDQLFNVLQGNSMLSGSVCLSHRAMARPQIADRRDGLRIQKGSEYVE